MLAFDRMSHSKAEKRSFVDITNPATSICCSRFISAMFKKFCFCFAGLDVRDLELAFISLLFPRSEIGCGLRQRPSAKKSFSSSSFFSPGVQLFRGGVKLWAHFSWRKLFLPSPLHAREKIGGREDGAMGKERMEEERRNIGGW